MSQTSPATVSPAAVPARAVPWAVVAILAVCAFGAYLRLGSSGPLPIDEHWRAFVRLEPGTFAFVCASFLAEIGTAVGVATCAAISAALLLVLRERRAALALLLACLIGVACSEAVKHLVGRPRPMHPLYETSGSSYPSGHSMGAAVLAVSFALIVAELRRRSREVVRRSTLAWASAAAALWLLAMMWSRTALGVHWLSDTVAGAMIGAAAALLAFRICGAKRAERTHQAGRAGIHGPGERT